MALKSWKGITSFYGRYERHISSAALVSGFIFDIFTLTRVDQLLENAWIIVHLAVAAAGIILLNLYERKILGAKETSEEKIVPAVPPTAVYLALIISIQFAFGGLLSTFLVFYFRSATFSVAWPFLLILIMAFVCNELLKRHYSRLSFQISYLFLSVFSFFIYFLPVTVHRLGADVFIWSGIVSLAAISLFIFLLYFVTREKFHRSKYLIALGVGGIYAIFNVLYFTNIIPPIPLSLKDAGVYHSVARDATGDYDVQYEDAGRFAYVSGYFRAYDAFHYVPGDPIYAYSSIFSPTDINIDVIHEWQYYDPSSKKWVTADRTELSLVGGRDQGFRTFSEKTSITPGLWRVNILTMQGQLIGRIKFEAVQAAGEPVLASEIK